MAPFHSHKALRQDYLWERVRMNIKVEGELNLLPLKQGKRHQWVAGKLKILKLQLGETGCSEYVARIPGNKEEDVNHGTYVPYSRE